ncbi:MAG: thiamine-phosphate kinase [Candidatus Aureabacteria bacterium]|nr:thiamine-phosphate kinase [Candidatus Auribacterota bacterium]
MTGRKISDIGEFRLIEEFKKLVKAGQRTLVGIGDDAAVIENPRGGMLTLFTTDMLVEGTHFELGRATPYQIGWKSLGCSLSDIAAMGGLPSAAVVSIGAPGELEVEFLRELYRGIHELAERFGCGIVGGDTVRSSNGLVISVAVLGEVEKEKLTLRSGARPGDGVWVTGSLGGSIQGKHLSFTPRVAEARFLVENYPVKAMMDLSDGLGSDLFRMAESSNVAFHIEEELLPIDLMAVGEVDRETALTRALYDGEDFELLVVLPPSLREDEVVEKFSSRFNCGLAIIGTVVDRARGISLVRKGVETRIREGGFSHFGPA